MIKGGYYKANDGFVFKVIELKDDVIMYEEYNKHGHYIGADMCRLYELDFIYPFKSLQRVLPKDG